MTVERESGATVARWLRKQVDRLGLASVYERLIRYQPSLTDPCVNRLSRPLDSHLLQRFQHYRQTFCTTLSHLTPQHRPWGAANSSRGEHPQQGTQVNTTPYLQSWRRLQPGSSGSPYCTFRSCCLLLSLKCHTPRLDSCTMAIISTCSNLRPNHPPNFSWDPSMYHLRLTLPTYHIRPFTQPFHSWMIPHHAHLRLYSMTEGA